MKSIIILLAIAGIIFIAAGYIQNNLQCPPPRIQYRYVEKTFDQEQNVTEPILSVAGVSSMFENSDPWMQANGSIGSQIKYGD